MGKQFIIVNSATNMRVFIFVLFFIIASILGKPAGIGGGGVNGGGGLVGGGGHVGGGPGQAYDYSPDPFHFQYGVHDDKYYTDFSEVRSGDEAGNIKGEYSVALPDGRIQHVSYLADGNYGGTIMDVKYDGEAHHPDYHGHTVLLCLLNLRVKLSNLEFYLVLLAMRE